MVGGHSRLAIIHYIIYYILFYFTSEYAIATMMSINVESLYAATGSINSC